MFADVLLPYEDEGLLLNWRSFSILPFDAVVRRVDVVMELRRLISLFFFWPMKFVVLSNVMLDSFLLYFYYVHLLHSYYKADGRKQEYQPSDRKSSFKC